MLQKIHPFQVALLLLFYFFSGANAQKDSTRLTAKFKFNDGFYTTLEQFRHNKPALPLSAFKGSIVQKTAENKIQFISTQTEQSLNLTQTFAAVIQGQPYLYYATDSTKKIAIEYQAVQIIGKLCYFSYTIDEVTSVAMPVYDPIGGKLLYTGKVKNKVTNTYRKLLNLTNGSITDLTLEGLKRATTDDKKLQKTLADFSPTDPLQRLLKTVQIYNDRNALFIY